MGVRTFLVLLALCAGAGQAAAEPEIDWKRGLLIVTETRIADLRAPNATIARIRAERIARDNARDKLLAAAEKIKLASGRTVANAAKGESRKRLDALEPLTLAVDYGSDGTATVTLGLPLEAIRVALFGPSRLASEREPNALVVDAKKLIKTPVLALGVSAAGQRYEGPTRFVTAAERGALELGKVIEVTGQKQNGDVIDIGAPEAVAAATRSGALLVFVIGAP